MNLDVALMRGGTSRGVVLRLEDAPPEGPARDAVARTLIGSSPLHGLGGGTPITNKVVLVGADLDYIVGNVSSDGATVDWSGTCGNMTSAVVPFALTEGLVAGPPKGGPYRLHNLATGGLVDVTVDGPAPATPGAEVGLTTSFLDPGGAVLGRALPSGRPREVIEVDGERYDATLVDVTHPYLLLAHDQVVGDRDVSDAVTLDRIERIRGTACVLLGRCDSWSAASTMSAAVPRVVLVHAHDPGDHQHGAEGGGDVRITAISMGQPIPSVPVTAALAIAAARGMDGTLVSGGHPSAGPAVVVVAGPTGRVTARADVDGAGHVLSAAVERTARVLLRGRTWV